MRTTAVNTTALALLLTGAALAWGQPGAPKAQEKAPPAKSKLEEMLAKALKDNPDIRVAAAKLGEAEAELNRVRLRVMQKVVTLYHTIEMARADVATAERALARMEKLSNNKVVSHEEVDAALAALAAAKAKLAAVEAEVPYVIGKQPQLADADAVRQRALYSLALMQAAGAWEADTVQRGLAGLAGATPRPVQGPIADRLRKALDAPVTLHVADTPADEVLKLLQKHEPSLHFKLGRGPGAPPKVSLELKDVSLGAALECLEDSLPNYRIVVREYGLLVAPPDRLPPGAVPLHDFWKGARGAGAKSPPAENVEGTIKQIEATGLLRISIGSDAGLAKGHTLEVYRPAPTPKYLGTIRIVAVAPGHAVGQPVGRMLTPPQPGDRVASRIKEK
jgi:hypothetical protein